MQAIHMKQIPWDATRASPLILMDCLHLRIRAKVAIRAWDQVWAPRQGQIINYGLPDTKELLRLLRPLIRSKTMLLQLWTVHIRFAKLSNWLAHDATEVTKMAKGCNCISNQLCCHDCGSAFFCDRSSDQHEDCTAVEYLFGSGQR